MIEPDAAQFELSLQKLKGSWKKGNGVAESNSPDAKMNAFLANDSGRRLLVPEDSRHRETIQESEGLTNALMGDYFDEIETSFESKRWELDPETLKTMGLTVDVVWDSEGNYVGAPQPKNEGKRMEVLRSLSILDTAEEEAFENVTKICQEFFEVPTALVSLVDTDRQWFKSHTGLCATETPRSSSFCAWTLLVDKHKVLTVVDTHESQVFVKHPLVVGEPHIRFYAGAPIVYEGTNIGTLCIIDYKPRHDFDAAKCDLLSTFADDVVHHLMERLREHKVVTKLNSAQEENLHLLYAINHFSEGFLLLELDWEDTECRNARILYANKGWSDITGYSKEDSLSQSIGPLLFDPLNLEAYEAAHGSFLAWLLRCAMTQEPGTLCKTEADSEYEVTHKEGYKMWACFQASPVPVRQNSAGRSKSGDNDMMDQDDTMSTDTSMIGSESTQILLHMSNITDSHASVVHLQTILQELAAAKVNAEKLEVMKNEFLGKMSREIRTPLNNVIGCAGLMEGRPDQPKEQKQFAHTIMQASRQLLGLVDDVLDFHRIDSKEFELSKQWFNLLECIDLCMEIQGHQTNAKDLELSFALDENVPVDVFGADTQLRQVMTNLLTNACKFTSEGFVQLTVSRVDKVDIPENAIVPAPALDIPLPTADDQDTVKLLFKVSDSGMGIPENAKDWIFKVFSQGDSSRTKNVQGTGLGLVISQRLVEYMGGRIWLTSTPNEGTQFCFTTKVQQRRRLSQNLVENTQRVARMITFFCVSTNERMHACMRGLLFHLGATKVNMVTSQGELSILLDMVNTHTSGAAQAKSKKGKEKSHQCVVLLDEDWLPCQTQSQIRKCMTSLQQSTTVLALGVYTAHADYDADTCEKMSYMAKPVTFNTLQMFVNTVVEKHFKGSSIRLDCGMSEMSEPSTGGSIEHNAEISVLIVEDNKNNQMVLTKILQSLGVTKIQVANNGFDGVRKAVDPTLKFDLICMDLHMPEMDGFDATIAILRELQEERPAIIAITADVMPGLDAECKKAGMSGYVTKPISKKKILDMLESLNLNMPIWGGPENPSH